MRVLVPTEELRRAIGDVSAAEIVFWDGRSRPPEADLWVAPYGASGRTIARGAEIPGLRAIQLQSAGYDGLLDHVPAGVAFSNAAGVHDDATAEHALGLLLASLRGLPEAIREQRRQHWHSMPDRQSLADARVLILGYGSIGRALAERLHACRAYVTGVASRPRSDAYLGEVHGPDDLDGLLPRQHAVVVLLPLSEATHHYVNAAFLASMTDGAVLVNVARGGVVDAAAVLAEAGRIRFALDVTDPEPLPADHPLWGAPDTIITPHIAGGTTAMLPRMAALVRAQIEHLVAGEPMRHEVISR